MDPGVLQQLAWGAIPPGIFGAVVFGAAWKKRGQPREAAGAMLQWSAGSELFIIAMFGVALFIMHSVIYNGPSRMMWKLPPINSNQWLPIGAFVAMMLAMAATLLNGQRWCAWGWAILAGVVVAGLGAATARKLIAGTWSGAETAMYVGGAGVGAFVLAWGLAKLAVTPGFVGAASAAIVAGSLANVMAGPLNSLTLAQWSGITAAFATPAAMLGLLRPAAVLPIGVAFVAAVALGQAGFQVSAYGSAKMTTLLVSLALVVSGPWAGVAMSAMVKPTTLWRKLLVLAAVALPGAIAMAIWLPTQMGEAGPEY